MTILAAILCRAFGHKPYEHPHLVWKPNPADWGGVTPTPTIVTRCKRCNSVLNSRPPSGDEWTIEA